MAVPLGELGKKGEALGAPGPPPTPPPPLLPPVALLEYVLPRHSTSVLLPITLVKQNGLNTFHNI